MHKANCVINYSKYYIREVFISYDFKLLLCISLACPIYAQTVYLLKILMVRDRRNDYHVDIVIFHLLDNPRDHHGLFSGVHNPLNEHAPTLLRPAILPTSMIDKENTLSASISDKLEFWNFSSLKKSLRITSSELWYSHLLGLLLDASSLCGYTAPE